MQADEREPTPQSQSLVTMATAGAVGGLAGAAIKLVCEAIVPPRSPDREPPPGVIAANVVRAVNGRELSSERQNSVALWIHWIFSVATSVMYGVIVSRSPRASPKKGIGFGIAVWAGLHEITLPLLRATPPLRKLPIGEQVNELISHVIFGTTVEYVRGAVLAAASGSKGERA